MNEVTPDGAKELSAALAGKSKLQKLNLRENELEDRGIILLCGPIQSLPSLRVLDLAQNQVRKHTRYSDKRVDLDCIAMCSACQQFICSCIVYTCCSLESMSCLYQSAEQLNHKFVWSDSDWTRQSLQV